MAKKGGVQQLQADIATDDDFNKFLQRPGLLVLDVYSEWCGPCLGMVGSLKKIKLELGGDNLHLAICKSDHISYLKRFRRKSEPTWLLVANGKAVNLMFGTNVPKLMKLIAHELEMLSSKAPRKEWEITELQPEEERRKKIVDDAANEANRIETTAREKKRREYLMQVTDIILENFPDIGVTVFGPQVNRDMFKKIMEPADALKIQCKDRKVTPVTREQFETVNFACRNPLSEEVLEQLDGKELLMCFWKIPEDSHKRVEELLTIYAHELTKPRIEHGEDHHDKQIPPIIAPMTVSKEIELEEWEYVNEPEPEPEPEEPEVEEISVLDQLAIPNLDLDDLGDNFGLDLGLGEEESEKEPEEEKEPVPVVKEPPKKRYRTVNIDIPPIWVPNNHRTHAALIYVFFHSQTTSFLPPDPTPEPPHLIMAFDAYKKKDLLDVLQKHREDIPAFGFFTSDDMEDTQFIASSSKEYSKMPHAPTDKIIFKVNKATSSTMLTLATWGPSYISPDTVIGAAEARKLFPEGYVSSDEASRDSTPDEAQEQKPKKKKGKKGSVVSEMSGAATEELQPAPTINEEGAATTSGEESGDSIPPTAAGEAPPPEEGAAPAESAAEPTAEASAEPAAETPQVEEPVAPPPEEEAPPS